MGAISLLVLIAYFIYHLLECICLVFSIVNILYTFLSHNLFSMYM